MIHQLQDLELIEEYGRLLDKTLLEIETFCEGRVLTASSRLQEVYVGKGAEAFFFRFEEMRKKLADNAEDIHRLRTKLKSFQNRT